MIAAHGVVLAGVIVVGFRRPAISMVQQKPPEMHELGVFLAEGGDRDIPEEVRADRTAEGLLCVLCEPAVERLTGKRPTARAHQKRRILAPAQQNWAPDCEIALQRITKQLRQSGLIWPSVLHSLSGKPDPVSVRLLGQALSQSQGDEVCAAEWPEDEEQDGQPIAIECRSPIPSQRCLFFGPLHQRGAESQQVLHWNHPGTLVPTGLSGALQPLPDPLEPRLRAIGIEDMQDDIKVPDPAGQGLGRDLALELLDIEPDPVLGRPFTRGCLWIEPSPRLQEGQPAAIAGCYGPPRVRPPVMGGTVSGEDFRGWCLSLLLGETVPVRPGGDRKA